MCEVSEQIYKEGKIEGIIEGKKKTAFNMRKRDIQMLSLQIF